MSTMYYTFDMPPDWKRKQIGQVHSLGKNKGYHFTWCMYPLDFADYVRPCELHQHCIVDEYNQTFSYVGFFDIVKRAVSQSFDERIE